MRAALSGLLIVLACGCLPARDATDEAIDECLAEARAAYYVGEHTSEEALAIYRECLRKKGVR